MSMWDFARGDVVADSVLVCSESTDAAQKNTQDYWECKHAHLTHMDKRGGERAVLVSIADKVHNIRALITDLERGLPGWKFNGTPGQVLEYDIELQRIAPARDVPYVLAIPLNLRVLEMMGAKR